MEDCNLSKNFIKVEWTIEKTLMLIELWEQHPCLYDRKSRQYTNKYARYTALTNIADRLKKSIPNITPEYVKYKIRNLRTQYNHALVKQNRSIKSGSDTEDVYEPSAYWYNKMSFLKQFIQPKQNTINSYSESVPKQESELLDPLDEVTVSVPSKKKKMDDDEVLLKASNVIASSLKKRVSEYPDIIETFGEYVKAQLNLMKNEDLRDDAIHEIMSILYEYKKKQRNT